MWNAKFFAFTLMITVFIRKADSRRRGSSPPTCSPRTCQVSSWSTWSPCSHLCGTTGTHTRARTVTVTATCGGSCPHLSVIRSYNRDNCQNSGTPTSNGCSCPPGYGGTCGETVSRPTASPTPSPVAPFKTTKFTALPSFTVQPTSLSFTPVMSSSVMSPVTIPSHVQRILVDLLGSLIRVIQRLQALLGGSLSQADLDSFQNKTTQIIRQAASQLLTSGSSRTSNTQMEKRTIPDFPNPRNVVQMLENIQRGLLG